MMKRAGPSFLLLMILVKQIEDLINEKFEGSDKFLVDVKVSPTNDIMVEFDADKGVSAQDCKELNRFLESELDRDKQDFALTVGSPGLDKPFKHQRQYVKNVGRSIRVVTHEMETFEGKLTHVDEDHIILERKIKKDKELLNLPFELIKETRVIISFK
ncbi:MAG: ribosome assembly cofactor RimP [Flavobacteriales bacterium]|nr:ribosome assembly cofactor RimP [Flavobacteriales bacterium]